MKNKRTTRVIASALAIASIIAMNPVGANAAWKQNSSGWWYTEGNSWATGWRLIDGKWYYFWPNSGYMAMQTTIDGYYVDADGAWVDDSNFYINASKAESIIKNNGYNQSYLKVKCSGFENGKWIVRVYEDNEYKTTNLYWFYVDANTGHVSSMY